jgi:hypothetical protein
MFKSVRIVEKVDVSGEITFIPQYKKLFFWFDFWNFEFPPSPIKFYSLSAAKEFIRKQLNKPKDKIHYYE